MKERFRTRFRAQRWLKYVPNSLTLCNSLCGFFAIIYMLRAYELDITRGNALGVFAVSALIICFAMVFDALDGFAARIFNAASMHGLQMDSLADMITFGVAPATLVAIMTHSLRDWELNRSQEVLVYLLSSVYLGCAALRLATYNIQAMLPEKKTAGDKDKFSGLPSPGAAVAICALVLFAYGSNIRLDRIAFLFPCIAAVLGLLMVSTIPYTHVGKFLVSARRNRKRLVFLIAIAVFLVLTRASGLLLVVTLYILSGPILALWRRFGGGRMTVRN